MKVSQQSVVVRVQVTSTWSLDEPMDGEEKQLGDASAGPKWKWTNDVTCIRHPTNCSLGIQASNFLRCVQENVPSAVNGI